MDWAALWVVGKGSRNILAPRTSKQSIYYLVAKFCRSGICNQKKLFKCPYSDSPVEKMPYFYIGEISRLVGHWFVLIVANICNNLRITFRFKEFVKSVGQGVLVIAGGSLLGLVVNFVYDEEKQSGSARIWTLMLASFFNTSYCELTVMILAFWLIMNKFFVSVHYDRGARSPPPQLVESPDPQHVRCVDLTGDLSSTNDPDLQLLFDFVGNEILKTRDEIRAYQDERLLLLRERIRAQCSGTTARSILPGDIASSSQEMAQPVSHGLTLTAHTKDLVPDVEAAMGSTVTVHGSKIMHRRFEIEFKSSNERVRAKLDDLRLQVIESMRLAGVIDKDCTFQFGTLAVLKNTDTGFKWWKLERHLTPKFLEIHRSPRKLSRCAPTWTIRGFNLQKATLKAASANRSEPLKVLHSQKMTSGEDVFVCEESPLLQSPARIFKDKIYIYASSFVEVEEGTTVCLQSEPISAGRPYLISELQGLVPSLWIISTIAGLSLLTTLGSRPCGAEDVLIPNTVEHSLSNVIILGPDSSQISSLPKIWTVLHNFLRVYIFAIFIPKCLLAVGLLARDFLLPLDFDVIGFEETPASREDFSSTTTTQTSGDWSNFPNATSPTPDEEVSTRMAARYCEDPMLHPRSYLRMDVSAKEENEFGVTHSGVECFDILCPRDGAVSFEDPSGNSSCSSPLSQETLRSIEVAIEELNPESTISSDLLQITPTSHSRSLSFGSVGSPNSSVGSDLSPKTRTVIILIAHTKYRIEPFPDIYHNLVELKNGKVVTYYLPRIHDNGELDWTFDVLGDLTKERTDGAIVTQANNLCRFLEHLSQSGVQVDIRIVTGSKTYDSLVEALKSLSPLWVFLDLSFKGQMKKVHAIAFCWAGNIYGIFGSRHGEEWRILWTRQLEIQSHVESLHTACERAYFLPDPCTPASTCTNENSCLQNSS